MLAATMVKLSGSEKKVNRNTYNISSIKRVTRKFLEVSRCSRAKQRQRNVQKKCAAHAKFFFRLIRPNDACFCGYDEFDCSNCIVEVIITTEDKICDANTKAKLRTSY